MHRLVQIPFASPLPTGPVAQAYLLPLVWLYQHLHFSSPVLDPSGRPQQSSLYLMLHKVRKARWSGSSLTIEQLAVAESPRGTPKMDYGRQEACLAAEPCLSLTKKAVNLVPAHPEYQMWRSVAAVGLGFLCYNPSRLYQECRRSWCSCHWQSCVWTAGCGGMRSEKGPLVRYLA